MVLTFGSAAVLKKQRNPKEYREMFPIWLKFGSFKVSVTFFFSTTYPLKKSVFMPITIVYDWTQTKIDRCI